MILGDARVSVEARVLLQICNKAEGGINYLCHGPSYRIDRSNQTPPNKRPLHVGEFRALLYNTFESMRVRAE
jgi:hypothetical protein